MCVLCVDCEINIKKISFIYVQEQWICYISIIEVVQVLQRNGGMHQKEKKTKVRSIKGLK